MSFTECIKQNSSILMEGALGERLKKEYGLKFDDHVAMAKLIYDEKGANALNELWQGYMDIARQYQLPFLAATPTRRANQERVKQAGYSESIIYDNVCFLREIQKNSGLEMYIGGLVGCKGDAYTGEGALTEEEAYHFHKWQADSFASAKVDFLYAGIMPVLSEAAGMAQAMADTGLPYMISFTIQSDGKLIDGTTITEAIQYIDCKTTRNPICYMTNCVHPEIVFQALSQPFNRNQTIHSRFWGIQANTSPLSYAELDRAAEEGAESSIDLKCSEPEKFAEEMLKLRKINSFKIWGGCCGTDQRHMKFVARKL